MAIVRLVVLRQQGIIHVIGGVEIAKSHTHKNWQTYALGAISMRIYP